MDDPYQSFNEGRFGQAPSGNTNWDEYNKGASVRALNQAELDRQQSFTDSFSSTPAVPTFPAGGGTTFGGFGGGGSFAGGGGVVNAAGPAGCLLLAPTRLAVVLGAVAAAHILLIKGTSARAIWHSALDGLKLRPE